MVKKTKTKKLYKEIIEENRKNIDFDETSYPIISEKNTRNIVEHIDEYDVDVAIKTGGVGGFNVIFGGLEDTIKDRIRMSKDEHPYYFDTVMQEIVIYRAGIKLTIKLNEPSDEVSRLKEAVSILRSFLH